MYQNMLVNIAEYIDITATDEWRAMQKGRSRTQSNLQNRKH